MPIVDKINALTGKTAETIEDAIANIDIGGSSEVPMEWVKIGSHRSSTADGFDPIDSNAKLMRFIHAITFGSKTLEEIVGGRSIIDVSVTPVNVTSNIFIISVNATSISGDGTGVELKRLGARARDCHAVEVTGLFAGPTGFRDYDLYALCVGEPQNQGE